MKRDDLIIVRGGGDLATGTIHRLWAAGLRVLVLEIENPAAIRRQVALCEAVYTKTTEVEGLRAVRIDRYEEAEAVWQENSVPILIDPKGVSIGALKPAVVIDAILAKRNLGTRRDMAPLTIALGPAIPNTGIPGVIGGYGAERVIHAQAAGIFKNVRVIGDIVEAGDTLAEIWQEDGTKLLVQTQITGILRGLLRDGYRVTEHFKVADVDPRKEELSNCFLISDKARCIAGSVLELVCAQLWK